MRPSILILSFSAMLVLSAGVDAKRCANGKGYRYIDGEKVCPEEMEKTPVAINPRTGEAYPIVDEGKGAINPRTGEYYPIIPRSGSGNYPR